MKISYTKNNKRIIKECENFDIIHCYDYGEEKSAAWLRIYLDDEEIDVYKVEVNVPKENVLSKIREVYELVEVDYMIKQSKDDLIDVDLLLRDAYNYVNDTYTKALQIINREHLTQPKFYGNICL